MIVRYSAFFFIAWLLSSCAIAPGMAIDVSESESELVEEYEGSTVYIKKISAEILNKYPELTQSLSHPIPEQLLKRSIGHYKLGAYDVVAVTVWEHPELSLPLGQFRSDQATGQIIDKDGMMFYPHVGTINVAGLTTSQLREVLRKKLKKLLNNPQIDVKVLRFRNKKVYVGGSVKNPGIKFVSDLPMTVPWAINEAGGLSSEADGSMLYLTRDTSVYVLDLVGMYRKTDKIEKILLQDEDKLHVASEDENKVFVLGEVVNPTAIPMNNGMLSLSQAIAEVGGVQQLSANAEGIYVLRAGLGSNIEVFHLDAGNPLGLVLGERFKLHPKDIVYVDTHGLAQWNRVIGLLLPTMSLMRGGIDGIRGVQDVKGSW